MNFTCSTCPRPLHHRTIQYGYQSCRICRVRAAYAIKKAEQTPVGKIVGEYLARFYQ